MAVQLVLPETLKGLATRLKLPRIVKLPEAVPPFNTTMYRLFWAIWILALTLAVAGPLAGLYDRYAYPENNSLLVLGSRAGIAVSDEDATRIRFTVGPYTRKLGIRAGDDIIAIHGLPAPPEVPVTEQALDANPDDPILIAFSDLLYSTDAIEANLRLRSPDGTIRDVTVTTGEQHIEAAARKFGINPFLLNFVDLLHVITYPFLIWASWILHRRNARDAVSSVLSLAILLTMGTEMPSANAIARAGIPREIHVFLYDLGNICLLSGILLFPHGRLSLRLILVIAALPVLMLLQGDIYRAVFMGFMLLAVWMLIRCLKRTPPGDVRQQIKWALYGFSSYAFFLAASLVGDMFKMRVGAFSGQMIIEMLSGLSLGLAFLSLQLGLLVALLKYRLYDAESVISRSASFAIVMLGLAAVFAGVMEGIIESMQNAYGDSVGTGAAVMGAAIATMLIVPLQERVQKWAERRIHKNLLDLREGLPEAVRDLREVADTPEFMHEVLGRINDGVRSVRSALVIDRELVEMSGISRAEVLRWWLAFKPHKDGDEIECAPDDPIFPIRIRLNCSNSQQSVGWLLVGPRPDGSLPSPDERHVLVEAAGPIARALRIVLKREKKEHELSEALAALASRIEQLERAAQL
jgi:hypothetical protein